MNYLSGGVGIGTYQPAQTLNVNGWIQTEGARLIINGFDGSPGNFWFRTTASEPGSVFMAFGASAGGDAVGVQIAPGGNCGVYVDNVGRVGIGTTIPATSLHLVSGGVFQAGATKIADSSGCYYS